MLSCSAWAPLPCSPRSRSTLRQPRRRGAPEVGSGRRLGRSETVDLGRHDEVVLVQAFDLVGVQGDGGVAPPEGDVGVMTLVLGERPHPVDEAERILEVPEPEAALDAPAFQELPTRRLIKKAPGLIFAHRRDAAAAWRAGSGCELAHRLPLPS